MQSTLQIKIYGIVQGVGFRPFVSRLAASYNVSGTVANRGSYVEIFACVGEAEKENFIRALRKQAPPRARIVNFTVTPWQPKELPVDFRIVDSAKESGAVFVSPDIAVCDACRDELFDPDNRRYLHPFINCTDCGPRLTIMESMPYDRHRTSMGDFPMCKNCAAEYGAFNDRRYDAQPVCCPDCGPTVYLYPKGVRGKEAITAVREKIIGGQIVAVKGIGGYHLVCDATNERAVELLRHRKKREQKPFAVMVRNLAAAEKICFIGDAQREILAGPEKPILLLPMRSSGHIAPSVAPGSDKLGVMLPYTPLHLLLFDFPDGLNVPPALVMTSGNPSGAPICHNEAELDEIAPLTDLILSHNRRIRLRADDSVMDWDESENRPYMIRRSRGYAPLPIVVGAGELRGQILATGGELKNTFCLTRDELFYLSPYIGDMSDLRTIEAFRDSVTLMESLLEINPAFVATDMHPGYQTGKMAGTWGKKILPVQHHYAHILSCMAENNLVNNKVIGVAMDGTGYGIDGTVWGGEIMITDVKGFVRVASIEPFCYAGGDRAAREGWRIALALMDYATEEKRRIAAELNLCSAAEFTAQNMLLERQLNAVMSTSAGRLFDAVSAILGIRRVSDYEAEAAMQLEYAARRYAKKFDSREFFSTSATVSEHDFLPTTELFNWLLKRRLAGENIERLAYDFHFNLASLIAAACVKVREMSKLNMVCLSGGVWQNTLLTELTRRELKTQNFAVFTHSLVPPNDGGLALGQAVAAMYSL